MSQNHKEHRFDRQIRLWGYHGQDALEAAQVLVLGSGPIATEFVKNLLLANVAGFTIMDDASVSLEDIGNNFFVTSESVGQSRASVAASLLSEMNADCRVESVLRDPISFIMSCCPDSNEFRSLQRFQLVIATEIPLLMASSLCDILFPFNTPLLYARSFGLIGTLRLAMDEYAVVETHPERDMVDLRLHPTQLAQFPELQVFLSSFDLSPTNSDEFIVSHIPFPAVLDHYAKDFTHMHPDVEVSSSALKALIASHNRFGSSNFDEAIRFAHYITRDPKHYISPQLKEILGNPKASPSSSDPAPFWIMVRALNRFLSEGDGFLPVSPVLPDMTADTSSFLGIKKIYADRAKRDRSRFSRYVNEIAPVPDAMIDAFVKNCSSLHVAHMRRFSHDLGVASDNVVRATIGDALDEEIHGSINHSDEAVNAPPNDIHWYVAIKSADLFHQRCGRYPGDCDERELQDDSCNMKAIAKEVFKQAGFNPDLINVDCLEEMVRFGSSSIHNTAALIGGLAAQEALKLLTKQYIVFNNTCIWNGVHATLARWTL